MKLEVILGITYVLGMIGYISLNIINKKHDKHYYNVKNEYKRFKTIKDEINQNQGWLRK